MLIKYETPFWLHEYRSGLNDRQAVFYCVECRVLSCFEYGCYLCSFDVWLFLVLCHAEYIQNAGYFVFKKTFCLYNLNDINPQNIYSILKHNEINQNLPDSVIESTNI